MKDESTTRPGVGVVETQIAGIVLPPEGLDLERGGRLPELQVAYETYGELSPERDNAIFICHALTGDAHVAGYRDTNDEKTRGWWDDMVGPGKGIDTDHYHVICANILGGCKGTTGPSSTNPETGNPYGSAFPGITIGDIVRVHLLLLEHLGIGRVAAAVGGSLGGMQVLEWARACPETLERCICIASAPSLSAQALAFDVVGRRAIRSDPDWAGGDYYGTGKTPVRGLSQARSIGHITYLSPGMMNQKFGRDRAAGDQGAAFQVESYLSYQGENFVLRFDANSYLRITEAMDDYDLGERYDSLERAFEGIRAKSLVVALSADWLFPPEQSVEVANALLRAGKRLSYCNLHAPHGHDAFLVDIEYLSEVVRAFLPWVGERRVRVRNEGGGQKPGIVCVPPETRKREYDIIVGMVRPGARVLDLGCGNGELLSLLAEKLQIAGIGVDIDIHHVIEVIDRGHDVFQGDIDAGLAMIPDATYDYAVLSETLQVVRRTRLVLRELLRVAREGIVSFPNFGKWSHRAAFLLRGCMPVGRSLPFEWYDTPNIHLFTLRDFVRLCREEGIRILDTACVTAGTTDRILTSLGMCNLGADRVLVKIARMDGRHGVQEGASADAENGCRCVRGPSD